MQHSDAAVAKNTIFESLVFGFDAFAIARIAIGNQAANYVNLAALGNLLVDSSISGLARGRRNNFSKNRPPAAWLLVEDADV